MHWRLNDVLGALMLMFPVWPIIAIGSATFLYVRHRQRIGPERRLPVVVYVLAVIVAGGVAAFGGLLLGIDWACAQPGTGNLCGLVGVLVTGPIAGTLAIVLVGLALSLIGPDVEPSR